MKRILLYCAILITLWFVPVRGVELEKMIPVEAVYIYKEENSLTIKTDRGNIGRGKDIEEAMRDMHEGASGIVFVDTADYLLVTDETKEYIPQLKEYLKSGVYLCTAEGEIDMEKAAQYLSVHTPSIRLKEWNSTVLLQVMYASEGQMYLK